MGYVKWVFRELLPAWLVRRRCATAGIEALCHKRRGASHADTVPIPEQARNTAATDGLDNRKDGIRETVGCLHRDLSPLGRLRRIGCVGDFPASHLARGEGGFGAFRDETPPLLGQRWIEVHMRQLFVNAAHHRREHISGPLGF